MDEKDFAMESIIERMDEMKVEIASLKEALAVKEREAESLLENGVAVDLYKVKHIFEDGFERIAKALSPLAEKADRNIVRPTREVVERVEDKIALNPLTAVLLALGAGVVVGKVCGMLACYSRHRDCHCGRTEEGSETV